MNTYQIFSDIDEQTLSGVSDWLDSLQDDSEATIEICSHGGLVFYGNAVYQKLLFAQKRGVHLTCRIWGICASSASDIALSCNRIEMAKTAAIMIHSAWSDTSESEDEGIHIAIHIANDAQLAVIHKRLPDYTMQDLKSDRWFKADEALKIGLIDSIFDDDSSVYSKLAAKYLAVSKGVVTMDEEKKEVMVEDEKVERREEQSEEQSEERPSIEDLFDALVDRVAELERRVASLEEGAPKAACGDDDKQNALLSAIQAKIAAICAPCSPKVEIKAKQSPKAELQEFKAKHPDIEKYILEK